MLAFSVLLFWNLKDYFFGISKDPFGHLHPSWKSQENVEALLKWPLTCPTLLWCWINLFRVLWLSGFTWTCATALELLCISILGLTKTRWSGTISSITSGAPRSAVEGCPSTGRSHSRYSKTDPQISLIFNNQAFTVWFAPSVGDHLWAICLQDHCQRNAYDLQLPLQSSTVHHHSGGRRWHQSDFCDHVAVTPGFRVLPSCCCSSFFVICHYLLKKCLKKVHLCFNLKALRSDKSDINDEHALLWIAANKTWCDNVIEADC